MVAAGVVEGVDVKRVAGVVSVAVAAVVAGFAGAELGWSELISAPDPMAAALRFWTAPR